MGPLKTYALTLRPHEAGFFMRDQAEWRSEPISGEAWTPLKGAACAAKLLEKLSDRVNDAGGLAKCELLILYEAGARELLGDLPAALRRLDCRRWEILSAEPPRRRAASVSGEEPGEGWPEAWTCGVLLPQLWRSLREEDPQERAERQRKAKDLEELEAENRKLAAQAERWRQSGAQLQKTSQARLEQRAREVEASKVAESALKAEIQRLRQREADLMLKAERIEEANWRIMSERELGYLQNPEDPLRPEALRVFLPAIYSDLWRMVGEREWRALTGSREPLQDSPSLPQPSATILKQTTELLYRLPYEAIRKLHVFCAVLPYRLELRPEMKDWMQAGAYLEQAWREEKNCSRLRRKAPLVKGASLIGISIYDGEEYIGQAEEAQERSSISHARAAKLLRRSSPPPEPEYEDLP